MSRFSGRCDLYDHIYMIGCSGTYKDTSEKEKFEIFKNRTGGLLHQRKLFHLDKYNIDREIEIVGNEKILSKKKVNNKWRYYYFGQEYKTLDSLNKIGYYCTIDIPFDTMLDLVKYYGYCISSMSSDKESEYICITEYSEIDIKRTHQYFRENKQYKFLGEMDLSNEYIRLVKKYYSKGKYEVIFQDEYNNLYQLGYYDTLEEAQVDVNKEISKYILDSDAYDNDDVLSMECRFGKDTVLGELKEYPSTFNSCIDKEIFVEDGVIYIRGFVLR